ncbi:uncharacterized protein FIBRA_08264 [Fibroporia radiculosa]|uniref:Coenzyme Q-binding protein COQ10 START domain-containing protein n=1 Tax=Fibroporia radiculosa TaxID=599839 RepID=J4GWH1_9APHY|nr:uncharacterized protein FIBRA_08264 [Fibroporia radiculosa]CCM06020.1 predicted protein [Fibroporia radiculosa]
MSNLPPALPGGVLVLSSSAVIDAPIEKVWDLLLNFHTYSEWYFSEPDALVMTNTPSMNNRNAFVHKHIIVDPSTNEPLPDQTPREGLHLLMEVHIPPNEDRSHPPTSRPRELITALDHESHRIAWRNLLPSWFLSAERWQALSVVENGKTLYETREIMRGPAAYLVRWFLGGSLQKGFQAVADGLKTRAEQLQQ